MFRISLLPHRACCVLCLLCASLVFSSAPLLAQSGGDTASPTPKPLPTVNPPERSGTNGAEFYVVALDFRGRFTDEEKAIMTEQQAAPVAKKSAALFAKILPLVDLIRQGRKASYIDWGPAPRTLADESFIDRLGGTQALAWVISWEANYRFVTDAPGAVSDLAAMETMSRSEVIDLLSLRSHLGVHAIIVRALAKNANRLTPACTDDINDIVDPKSTAQALQHAVDGETRLLQSLLDEYTAPTSRGWSDLKKRADALHIDPVAAAAQVQWLQGTEKEFADKALAPQSEYQHWWTQKTVESSAMLLLKKTMADLDEAAAMLRGSQVQNAMLQAGIALQQHDQARFSAILDPISGAAFGEKQTTSGFQLTSAFLHNGKNANLSFPEPPEKKE